MAADGAWAWPSPVHVVYYTKFMVRVLQKAGSFVYQQTLQTIAELRGEAVSHFVADPLGALRAPSKMMDILGVDMVYDIFLS